MISEYRASPHTAVKCTVKKRKSEKLIRELKVLKKLPLARGGKASDKDNDVWQILGLKQYKRYLEEGIDEENKHFKDRFKRRSGIW